MKAGTLLAIVGGIINVLQTQGYITAAGDFDQTKFDNVQSDTALAQAVEGVLKANGVTVPDKVDKIIQIVPLVVAIVQ